MRGERDCRYFTAVARNKHLGRLVFSAISGHRWSLSSAFHPPLEPDTKSMYEDDRAGQT